MRTERCSRAAISRFVTPWVASTATWRSRAVSRTCRGGVSVGVRAPWQARVRRALRAAELNSRVPATLLIALGGFFPSIADGLTRFGITWGLFLGQFIGVLLIFLGFLVSIEVFSDVRLPFTRIVLRRRDRAERANGTRGAI